MDSKTERFFEVSEQRQNLINGLEAAEEITRPLFEKAVETADRELASLISDPTVSEEVTVIGSSTQTALSQLEELSGSVRLGLVDPAVIEAKKQEILADPVRRLATAYLVAKTGLVKSEVTTDSPSASVKDLTAKNDETIRAILPARISLVIRDDVISFETPKGATGKLVELPKKSENENSKKGNYAQEIKELLRVLVTSESGSLGANELWDKAFPGLPYDRLAMKSFRTWMVKLTYRKQPIIEHNGHRGLSSKYTIDPQRFDVTLKTTEVVSRKSNIPTTIAQPPSRQIAPLLTDEQAAIVPKDSTENKIAKLAENQYKKEYAELEEQLRTFPLTIPECNAIAALIDMYKEVLDDLGVQVIPTQIVETLRIKTSSDLVQAAISLIKPNATIKDLRRIAVEKIEALFKEEEAIYTAIDSISRDDDRYLFFTYLCEFEDQDRQKIFRTLLDAERITTGKFEPRTGRPSGFTTKILLPDGKKIIVGETKPNNGNDSDSSDSDVLESSAPEQSEIIVVAGEEENVSDLEMEGSSLRSKVSDLAAIAVETTAVLSDKVESEARQEFEKSFRNDVKKWLEIIDSNNLGGKLAFTIGNTFSSQGYSFPYNQISKVVSAKESGLIDRNSEGFTVRDILIFNALYSSRQTKAAMAVSNHSKQKPDKSLMLKIIDEEIRLLASGS
jgi:hypothetical protein